jgi:hypothetical protein
VFEDNDLKFSEGYTMKFTLTAISILMVLFLFSCRQKEEKPQEQAVQAPPQISAHPQVGADLHTGVVQEVLQATAYTYLNVRENDANSWIAVTKREIQPGQTISFVGGLEMKDFESKDLQRTFETLYFVDRLAGDGPSISASQESAAMPHQTKPSIDKKEISIEPVAGGITIGELFTNRDSYAGKTVSIKGQVTKINRAIMDRNWIHLQDGTSGAGSFDLTITTQDDATVGEIVTFEGAITLNKDFGSGYAYEVLMENAKRKTAQ